MGMYPSKFAKAEATLTREYVHDFLEGLGLNPDEIQKIEIFPQRMIITRFLRHADGRMILDHLGPRVVETHITIRN